MASNLCIESEDENASCYEADLTDPMSAEDCQGESHQTNTFDDMAQADLEDQGDFLFMACADWENMKEDSDLDEDSDSQPVVGTKEKRLLKFAKKQEDAEHKLINKQLEEQYHPHIDIDSLMKNEPLSGLVPSRKKFRRFRNEHAQV